MNFSNFCLDDSITLMIPNLRPFRSISSCFQDSIFGQVCHYKFFNKILNFSKINSNFWLVDCSSLGDPNLCPFHSISYSFRVFGQLCFCVRFQMLTFLVCCVPFVHTFWATSWTFQVNEGFKNLVVCFASREKMVYEKW